MVSKRLHSMLPEWEGFAQAVRTRRPDRGTWCQGWTVRDVLIHQTGNADEFARVLSAHMAGQPVDTRSFAERERSYRVMTDAELWAAFIARCEHLTEIAGTAKDLPAATAITWTGRTVNPSFFAEHMRQELVLHRWDITGDDATATRSLAEPWMAEHSVEKVGAPLLVRGSTALDFGPTGRVEGRLRTPGTDDILIAATAQGSSIEFVAPVGAATIESDPAVRVLFLWGRRPADPSRWCSTAGPKALDRVRTLLSGY